MSAIRFLLLAVCWATSQFAAAQTPAGSSAARSPTEAEVAAVAKKYAAPSIPTNRSAPVRIDKMPAARISDVDLDQIAGGYAREVQDRLRAGPGGASVGLYIFISLSLPQQTLDRIFDQAARAQGVIVIRGLADGSMQKTLQRVKQLIGQRQVGVQIDPQAFERYAVTSVPSVVLTHQGDECGAASCPASGFVKATGDVSLDYVLERFAQIPKSAAEANRRLQTLRGHP